MATKKQPAPRKTILIADDDRDLTQLLTMRCRQSGFDVFRSPDAMHALLGTHRIRPDLIVLDVQMPGGNGLSVCEMLAGDVDAAKTPVIVMSGVANDEMRLRCQALGARFIEKGSTFWERLEPLIFEALGIPQPVHKPEPPPAITPEAPSPSTPADETVLPLSESATGGASDRPKVLCIDDDPELSKSLKLRLELYGVEVLRAFNGMQGYWTALDMNPDLILLDLLMPEGEGNYIFGRLKMHPLTAKVPVVVLTGQNTPAMRRKMFGLGVDGFLTKPVNFDALLEMLRQYLPLGSLSAASPAGEERPGPRSQPPGRERGVPETAMREYV